MTEKKRPRGRPRKDGLPHGSGRGWTSIKPGTLPIRLTVTPETAVEFRRLASSVGTDMAGLARRLTEAAVEAGPNGSISLPAIKAMLDREYQADLEAKLARQEQLKAERRRKAIGPNQT